MTRFDPAKVARSNVDEETVASFGDEWSKFDQTKLPEKEQINIFNDYFRNFPWHRLPAMAEGFDMGCGTGRWAKLVAPRVGLLNCIDASAEALDVAREHLANLPNARFIHAPANASLLQEASQDFGYSLGVLHHVPDTASALAACVRLLKPGAPFLVYLYYRFDNRPVWFRAVWQASELLRGAVSSLPPTLKHCVTDLVALAAYWPLARLARFAQKVRLDTRNMPLQYYKDKSFYTMRTDSRDRFGTPLEQRFTRNEIRDMMERAGLRDILFSEMQPFWCALGVRK